MHGATVIFSVAALADGDRLAFRRAGVSAGSLGDVSDLRNLLVIPLSDYNRVTGKDENTLGRRDPDRHQPRAGISV